MSSNTPAIRPHVEIVNGQLVTNSFKIAEHFGKQHKDVLRAIDGLECSSDFRQRNFAPTSAPVPMPRGGVRHIKAYSITRDGFTFLAMGFTGPKAAQWKEAYISAFNQMESALREPHSQPATVPLLTTPGSRLLVHLDHDGSQHISAIPHDCYILNRVQIVRAIGCGQDLPLSTAELAEVIERASGRLARVLGHGRA